MTEKVHAVLLGLVNAAMLLGAARLGRAAEPPYLVVPHVEAGTTLETPDPGWARAARLRLEQPVGEDAMPKVRLSTEIFVLSTADDLYFRFACTNPAAPNFQARQRDRDAEAYEDESVEIFLDVRDGTDYVHLVVNASGSVYDGRKLNKAWDGDWKVSVRPTEGGWEATVRIPFRMLGGPPATGTYWFVNICRNACGPDGRWERSAWIPPGYHRPVGLLCFGDIDARPLFGRLHAAVTNLRRLEAVGTPGAGGDGGRITASIAALESQCPDQSKVPPDRFARLLGAAEDVSRSIEPSVRQAVMRAILESPSP